MTKVDLITGFLGVGKTTFIKKYADYLTARGEKVHIIENEFGGISIDARTLRKENCDVSQITGGCMCCTGKASFMSLLSAAAMNGFDRILVEPSGIYDANQFFDTIMTPPVCNSCQVGNIITIADSCPDALLSPEARYLMYSQLINTGCIVMSKTQLRQPGEIAAAREGLQDILQEQGSTLNSREAIVTKPWDDLTDGDFAAIASCGYHRVAHSYAPMDHMSIFSTSILAEKFDTLEHLEEILHRLLNTEEFGKIYRIKGYISDLSKHYYEVNCSPSGCFIQEAPVRRGVFLLIGQNYDEQAIKALFVPKA